MPTDCTPNFFEFEAVEGRKVVAAFDACRFPSDRGAGQQIVESSLKSWTPVP
jgi:hypothetical protein